jgi:hypothetical protein
MFKRMRLISSKYVNYVFLFFLYLDSEKRVEETSRLLH